MEVVRMFEEVRGYFPSRGPVARAIPRRSDRPHEWGVSDVRDHTLAAHYPSTSLNLIDPSHISTREGS